MLHARPKRGENRKGLGLSKLLSHPAVAALTIGIVGFCAAAIATSAFCAAVKLEGSPATTNAGPPGAVRSILEVWFALATRLALYSYRNPKSNFRLGTICQPS